MRSLLTKLAVSAVALATVLLLAAILRVAWGVADLESVATVQHQATQLQLLIAAIGLAATVGLVSITGYYAWQTRAMAREMQLARERDSFESRTRQAQQVAAWLHGDVGKRRIEHPESWLYSVGAQLRNGSNQPAYDVRIHVETAHLEGDGAPRLRAEHVLNILPPQCQRPLHVECDPVPYRAEVRQPDVAREVLTLELSFRDSAGRCWHRDALGRLREDGSSERPITCT